MTGEEVFDGGLPDWAEALVEPLADEVNLSGATVLEGAHLAARAVLAGAMASGNLINPADLQGSVGVVLGQLRESRSEAEALGLELQACREAMALQVAMRQSAEEELQVTRSTVRVLADQVTALVEGRVVDAGEQVRELADRCAVMRVGLLRIADEIDGHGTVSAARVRKLAES